jgi:hypothetical protein
MDDEFLKKWTSPVRELAETADPFTRRRLIILADDYEKQLNKPEGSASPTTLGEEGQT